MEMTKPSKNQDGSVRWRPSSHEKDPSACRAVVLTQVQPRRTIFGAFFMFRSTRESKPGRSWLVSVRQVHGALPVTHTLLPWCDVVTWCLRRTLLRRRVDMRSPNLFFGGCFAVEGLRPLQISLVVLDFFTLFLCVILWGSDASSLCGARRIIAACREYCPSQDVYLLSPWRLGTAGRP